MQTRLPVHEEAYAPSYREVKRRRAAFRVEGGGKALHHSTGSIPAPQVWQ